MLPSKIPGWLGRCKDNVAQSEEWKNWITDINLSVLNQLKESRLKHFTDLSPAEKELFLTRAFRATQNDDQYQHLKRKIFQTVEKCITQDIAQDLLDEFPVRTKDDILLEHVEDGVIHLLRRWPELKWKLRVCLNRPLPERLRQVVWRLVLSNTDVRQRYALTMKVNPKIAISVDDQSISQRCEVLLHAQPTFELLRNSVGAFYGMKAILSYYHAIEKKGAAPLTDIDHLLMVPFIFVALPSISRTEPPSAPTIALLVEEYFDFMRRRPAFMLGSIKSAEVLDFGSELAGFLKEIAPGLCDYVTATYEPHRKSFILTKTGHQDLLRDVLIHLTLPVLRTLFVGYVSAEVVLYIWDNYLLGLDVPGYATACLLHFVAAYLVLLQDSITSAPNPSAVDSALQTAGLQLQVRHFQLQINNRIEQLRAVLHADWLQLPSAQPISADGSQWRFYLPPISGLVEYNDTARLRLAKERRDEEKRRLLAEEHEQVLRKQEAERRRFELDELQKRQTQTQLYKLEHRELSDEIAQLEALLDAERRMRHDTEQKAQQEMGRLRAHIRQLQQERPLSSADSAQLPLVVRNQSASVADEAELPLPPPPSAESYPHTPEYARQQLLPNRSSAEIVVDLFKRINVAVNRVYHGDGLDSYELNSETQRLVDQHSSDLAAAELHVLGRELAPAELDSYVEPLREEIGAKLITELRHIVEERRRHQLLNGQKRGRYIP